MWQSLTSQELICSWLRLAPDQWPPDHYTLLGLEPGACDAKQIEGRAQKRMEQLRSYQLAHPEQATEGMNRLAQALVCLTDPIAKQAYDAQLGPKRAPRAARPSKFRRSRVEEAASRTGSRWLLFAWALWLSLGVLGLAAVALNFTAIKESYFGVTEPVHGPTSRAPARR